MDQIIALDLRVRRALEQASKGLLTAGQELLTELECRFQDVKKLNLASQSFMDEMEVIQSQLALLKRLLSEDRFSDVVEDVVSGDDGDDGEDEDKIVQMIQELLDKGPRPVAPSLNETNLPSPRVIRQRRPASGSPKDQLSATQEVQDKVKTASFFDDLSQMLVNHGTALKKHTQEFAKLLADDTKALEQTQTSMATAGDRFHRESANLRVVRTRKPSLLHALFRFSLIVLAFFIMYIFIKIT